MTLEYKRRVRDLETMWSEYLELLSTCEIALLEKKVFFLQQKIKKIAFYIILFKLKIFFLG